MNGSEPNPNPNVEKKCPQCGATLPSGVLEGLCPACLLKQGAAAETAVPPENAPFVPPSVEEVARLFPQLEIISLIGKGGMGAVYKARQPGLDRIVALKILPPQSANDPGFIERFNREARALARLNHPNIVAVYEFGQVNGLHFFIMEYVDGVNLRELERSGKLQPREALQIVPQICEALQFAHDEGIVHRDIKPENILVDKKGRVKIADFGIAKILGREPGGITITETGGTVGTPLYMAPEQMERPTSVDHRADIFSLGVVFYEMLTGELPMGKFAPPSTRKVEVDVRLDEVVLRALERDPERRYQAASQVKTAVDSIAGSPGTPPPKSDAGASLASRIIAHDYELDIRNSVRCGWELLRKNLWPLVGVTALVIALLTFAGSFGAITLQGGPMRGQSAEISSLLAMLVWGPLLGGLGLFYKKKIRGEKTTIETAFSGFSHRFLHLFLAGFVTSLLIWLGFLCFILPGIYLLVAWMFTLPLVMDKNLDFWSAIELSRKVVTKHWWKFFGLAIVLWLLFLLGAFACGIGVFFTAPLVIASLMCAYESVFSSPAASAAPAPGATGPTGTVVMPPPPKPAAPAPENWTLSTKIGLALVAVVILIVAMMTLYQLGRRHEYVPMSSAESTTPPPAPIITPSTPAEASVKPSQPDFGQVFERDLTNFTALTLDAGQTRALPESVASLSRGPEKDVAISNWMAQAGVDIAYLGQYDGFYALAQDIITLPRDGWDHESPDALAEALHGDGHIVGIRFGDASPLNNPAKYTYGLKIRDGDLGLLQITDFTGNSSAAKIRYKLSRPPSTAGAANSPEAHKLALESLHDRLEAASSITDLFAQSKSLTLVAIDAAKIGSVDIATQALAGMRDGDQQNKAAQEVARTFFKHGMRKQAIDIAKEKINDLSLRNQTLSELAQ